MWHNILHYGLIVLACWIGICILIAVFSKSPSSGAGTSVLPLILMFFIIAMIVPDSRPQRSDNERRLRCIITIIVAVVLAALLYWHTAIWIWLASSFAG